ncbi:MAG: proline dehydrogenase family protein [Fermentimonas sp.]|nr:proline dehydrogenase family protein [Fermentimonas sp.]
MQTKRTTLIEKKGTLTDLENTELAFRDLSDADLRQAYQLFKVMNNRNLVKTGEFLVKLAFAIRFPVKGILRRTIYRHFVGGMSILDCSKTIAKLGSRNVDSILDYALEGEESEEVFDATCEEIIRTVEFAKYRKNVPFSAFKITGIGRFDLLAKVSANETLTDNESLEFKKVEDRMDSIFRKGYEINVPILIDAEETWIQPVLDEMVLKLMAKYNKEKAIVQNTYQLYCRDGLERLKQHHYKALKEGFKFGLKIVRGAYMEKERERAALLGYPSPIQPDKESTDRDFDAAIHYLLENHETIDFMVSTHNENSSLLLARLIDEYGLPRNYPGIYFSQLYGMSDHITYGLAEHGYNVAKYVPYGEVKTMMPYLFRRAEENTSMKGQTSRELRLIHTEIKRRKEERRENRTSESLAV